MACRIINFPAKEEVFRDRNTETVPQLPSKQERQSEKKKRENVSETDKVPPSYTKAITAFRIELNAEAEFCHSLVPEVTTANFRQKRYSV